MQYLTDLQLEILEKIAAILPLRLMNPVVRRQVEAAAKKQRVIKLKQLKDKLKEAKPQDKLTGILEEYLKDRDKPLPKPDFKKLRDTEFDRTFGPLKNSKRNQ